MIRTEDLIKLEVSPCNLRLIVGFKRNTNRTVYDICDLNGRIIKTGLMHADEIEISVSELENEHYVVLILDGDRMYSRKFSINK